VKKPGHTDAGSNRIGRILAGCCSTVIEAVPVPSDVVAVMVAVPSEWHRRRTEERCLFRGSTLSLSTGLHLGKRFAYRQGYLWENSYLAAKRVGDIPRNQIEKKRRAHAVYFVSRFARVKGSVVPSRRSLASRNGAASQSRGRGARAANRPPLPAPRTRRVSKPHCTRDALRRAKRRTK